MTTRVRFLSVSIGLLLFVAMCAMLYPSEPILVDFGCFPASAAALANGQNPFVGFVSSDGTSFGPNLNPPIWFPLFTLLSRLAPLTASRLWFLFAALCYLATIGLLWKGFPTSVTPARILWALSIWPAYRALMIGQAYTLLALLVAVTWWLLATRRYAWAGIVIGLLAALKPFLLVWPVLLWLTTARRASIVAAVTFVCLTVGSVFLYGPTVFAQWLVAGQSAAAIAGLFPHNASLFALVQLWGVSDLGLPAASILLGLILIWAWRARPLPEQASVVGILAGLLATPIAWHSYALLLLPALFSRRIWSPSLIIAGALLIVPLPFVFLWSSICPLWGGSVCALLRIGFLLAFMARAASPSAIDPRR